MPKFGEALRLACQLYSGRTDLYVRGYAKDSDGVDLIGSPVDLVHVGNGLYEDDSLSMPGTPQATVTFRVFKDALHTKHAPYHGDTLDVFHLETQEHLAPDFVAEVKSGILVADFIGSPVFVAEAVGLAEGKIGSVGFDAETTGVTEGDI